MPLLEEQKAWLQRNLGAVLHEVDLKISEAEMFARKKEFDRSDALLDEAEEMLGVAEQMVGEAEQPVKSVEEIKYLEIEEKYTLTIETASGMSPEIGSADVIKTHEKAKKEADATNWNKATDLLTDAHRKAKLVIKRAPFLIAKQKHQPKIEASFNIKDKGAGDKFKAEWKDLIGPLYDKEKQFDSDAAKKRLDALLEAIRKKNDELEKDLKAKKEDLAKLKAKLENPKNIPAEDLYNIALEILKNNKATKDLGFDPGENARKPFIEDENDTVWTAGNCEQAYKDYDWFALKDCLKAGKINVGGEKDQNFTEDGMWKLFQYRGKVVNEEIDKQRKAYPTLIAKASGSEDIGSDIDITFATPKSGDDVAAAQGFNEAIIKRYGKPAGRVFDVNIYPRDYGAIKESFKPDYLVDANPDDDIDEPDQEASLKLSKIDQDVATLLKQRRFMSQKDFDDMLTTMLASAPGGKTGEVAKQIKQQYEEGEDLYFLTSLQKVEKIRDKVNVETQIPDAAREKRRQALLTKLKALDKISGKGGLSNLQSAQALVPEILDLFEETYQDDTMEVTDALYLEKMGSLRKDQATILSLKTDNQDTEQDHPGKTCEQEHGSNDHAIWREQTLNALEVKVKKDMFTNILFANEAIMSQGAIKHIVEALQAKDDEEKIKKLEKLSASDLMQSVNEQVADLFKEMKHFEGVIEEESDKDAKECAIGEAFVHASKYFFRLLDAAISLNLKYQPPEVYPSIHAPYDAVDNSINNKDLKAVKERVEEVLLQLRKSSDIPADVKGKVGASEMKKIFPKVTNIETFRSMVTDFAKELNNRIRSLDEFQRSQQMSSEGEKAAQKAYFEVAETDLDKAKGVVTGAGANPLKAERSKALQEALTLLGLSDAEAISNAFKKAATAVAALGAAVGDGAADLVNEFEALVNGVSDRSIKLDLSMAVTEYRKRIEKHALTQERSDP